MLQIGDILFLPRQLLLYQRMAAKQRHANGPRKFALSYWQRFTRRKVTEV